MTDTCPDCERPIATELGPISPNRPCARHLHPVGADDCMMVALERKDETITCLRQELATLTAKYDLLVAAHALATAPGEGLSPLEAAERRIIDAADAWEDSATRVEIEAAELALACAIDELRAERAKAGR